MHHKIPIDYHPNSQVYFDAIKQLPFGVWLDSGKPASDQGRFDILSALPNKRLVVTGQTMSLYDHQSKLIESTDGDPFEQLKRHSIHQPIDSELPFFGGLIGYISYDLGKQLVGIDQTHYTAAPLPDLQMGVYHWALIQDHLKRESWLTALPNVEPQLLARIYKIIESLQTSDTASRGTRVKTRFKIGTLRSNLNEQNYLYKLSIIDELIHAGDCYQVNFAQRFSAEYQGEPYHAYLALRDVMASPFSGYLDYGDQAVMCLSPERFIQVKDKQVMSQPIKGTIKRGATTTEDKQLATQLLNSTKDKAENVMIVDLLRNDLSKSCELGSVNVPELFSLESFANVHHLVSMVTGQLKAQASSIDALALSFPGGSITGAPKKRAMEIIAQLEPDERGLYCGSIGYINQNDDMDMNITIRTVVCDGKTLSCSGGGGIVADSIAELEYQESLTKIQLILETLNTFEKISE